MMRSATNSSSLCRDLLLCTTVKGVLGRPRHHPHPPGDHRQRGLLPLGRLLPHRHHPHQAPPGQAFHTPAQRQGRALPADHGRKGPLRPASSQRERTCSGPGDLEHPPQPPSAPQLRRWSGVGEGFHGPSGHSRCSECAESAGATAVAFGQAGGMQHHPWWESAILAKGRIFSTMQSTGSCG